MSTRVDIEELQTTKSEKLLAAVLAIFLLIGGIWAYQKIDDWVQTDRVYFADPGSVPAVAARDRAQERVFVAHERQRRALQQLELRREAYRTSLDEGRPDPALRHRYVSAERAYRRAQEERAAAQRELREVSPAAAAAERRYSKEAEAQRRRDERNTFFWRLALALAALVLAYQLLWQLHSRESRYLPLAFAAVVSATLLALVMAGDYATDYFNPFDLGPLILALVGSVLTIATFYGLQRYLARRLPTRRVRKDQCPYCGYRTRGNPHCEGCGRELVAPCAKCDAERRVGTLHCRACGAM